MQLLKKKRSQQYQSRAHKQSRVTRWRWSRSNSNSQSQIASPTCSMYHPCMDKQAACSVNCMASEEALLLPRRVLLFLINQTSVLAWAIETAQRSSKIAICIQVTTSVTREAFRRSELQETWKFECLQSKTSKLEPRKIMLTMQTSFGRQTKGKAVEMSTNQDSRLTVC